MVLTLARTAPFCWMPVKAFWTASLARILVLPFNASIGVSFSYLGGTLTPYLELEKPYSVSLIFGVDF